MDEAVIQAQTLSQRLVHRQEHRQEIDRPWHEHRGLER
jgi:hypothetical protein